MHESISHDQREPPFNLISMESLHQSKPTFGVLLNSADPEVLLRQAKEFSDRAEQIKQQKEQELLDKKNKDFLANQELLKHHRSDLEELEELLSYSDKMTQDELKKNLRTKKDIEKDIDRLETILGLSAVPELQSQPAELEAPKEVVSKWPTIAKILALVFGCWTIVSFSGDFILDKYPNAAIYNDVSFQKVLFAFSVFIFSFAAVIAALAVFFPGISKYFNPFNRDQLDFFQDFKSLDQWQRTIISVALFSAVLFSFVLLVSGKLD